MSYQYKADGMPETADRNMEQAKSVICNSDNEQSKVVSVPKHHNMKKYGVVAVNLIAFLILVLDGEGAGIAQTVWRLATGWATEGFEFESR
jgi:hypothetical protein